MIKCEAQLLLTTLFTLPLMKCLTQNIVSLGRAVAITAILIILSITQFGPSYYTQKNTCPGYHRSIKTKTFYSYLLRHLQIGCEILTYAPYVNVFPLNHLRAEIGSYTAETNFYVLKYFFHQNQTKKSHH